MVRGAGSDFSHGGNAAQKFVERLEVRAEFGVKIGEPRRAEQLAGGVVVALLQRAAELECGLAFAFSGGASHGQQRVGDLGHGADHDDRLLRKTAFHDRCDAFDRFGVFHRSATKLHDNHRWYSERDR